MTPYVLREARHDELPTVIYHRRRMYEEMGYSDASQLAAMEKTSTEFFGRAFDRGTYRGWFIDVDGVVVAGGGVIVLPFQPQVRDPRPERPWIVNVFTEPEYRRQGLARVVMEAMIAWCRREAYTVVSLHASAAGRPVYTAMGFKPTNEMRLFLGPPVDPMAATRA